MQATATGGIWPLTLAGWIALALAVAAILGGFITAGRFLGTLNGFGVRLTDLEKAHEKAEGERATMQRQVDRILDQLF